MKHNIKINSIVEFTKCTSYQPITSAYFRYLWNNILYQILLLVLTFLRIFYTDVYNSCIQLWLL